MKCQSESDTLNARLSLRVSENLQVKMAEETAKTLRSRKDKKRLINAVTALYGK
jgi:hypothetical protein